MFLSVSVCQSEYEGICVYVRICACICRSSLCLVYEKKHVSPYCVPCRTGADSEGEGVALPCTVFQPLCALCSVPQADWEQQIFLQQNNDNSDAPKLVTCYTRVLALVYGPPALAFTFASSVDMWKTLIFNEIDKASIHFFTLYLLWNKQ